MVGAWSGEVLVGQAERREGAHAEMRTVQLEPHHADAREFRVGGAVLDGAEVLFEVFGQVGHRVSPGGIRPVPLICAVPCRALRKTSIVSSGSVSAKSIRGALSILWTVMPACRGRVHRSPCVRRRAGRWSRTHREWRRGPDAGQRLVRHGRSGRAVRHDRTLGSMVAAYVRGGNPPVSRSIPTRCACEVAGSWNGGVTLGVCGYAAGSARNARTRRMVRSFRRGRPGSPPVGARRCPARSAT